MATKVYIYKSFERFWHWTQFLLISVLALTGFEIHGSYIFLGYENAVDLHNISAYAFLILIAFAIFWHFSTGEWKQYLPTARNLKAQVNYYLLGIFKNAPHPTKKTVLSKLNPLQKLVYLGLKVLIIPVMVISGLLYMYYRYPHKNNIEVLNVDSLENIAVIHTAGAFMLISFVIAHLYLITTGTSITSNLKAMITGYEDIEEDEHEAKKSDESVDEEYEYKIPEEEISEENEEVVIENSPEIQVADKELSDLPKTDIETPVKDETEIKKEDIPAITDDKKEEESKNLNESEQPLINKDNSDKQI